MVATDNRLDFVRGRNLVDGFHTHRRYYGKLLNTLPKCELHVHLEGSVEPETLVQLDPGLPLSEARKLYEFDGFQGFLEAFKAVSLRLHSSQAYAMAARQLFRSLARQHVCYAEVTLSVGVVLWKGQSFDAIFAALEEERAQSRFPVRWIFDAVRHFGLDHAWQVARLAARNRQHGVVGFGLGGDERRGPIAEFAPVSEFIRGEGLAFVPHSGETGGAAEVWHALQLGARRIGHGIAAAQDRVLLRELADRSVPLEISLSSNVRTGVVPSLAEHPMPEILQAGVPVVLNTDDPGLFQTTLVGEYELARDVFRLSERHIRELAENSFRYALDEAAAICGRQQSGGQGVTPS